MKDKVVKKELGVSWVEVKNQVPQFRMGCECYLKHVEINQYME